MLVIENVRCTNCGAGWTDYLGAVAGLLGAVLAGVALTMTRASAADAKASRVSAEQSAIAAQRSAAAAEAELTLFREEVEHAREDRARRAAFEICLTARGSLTSQGAPPMIIAIDFGIKNTGSRPAQRVAVNVVVPCELALKAPRGKALGRIATTESHDVGRGPEPCVYWSAELGPLDREVSHVIACAKIERPRIGTYPIYVELMNDDLPGHARAELWEIVVPPFGEEVPIRSTNSNARLWRPTT